MAPRHALLLHAFYHGCIYFTLHALLYHCYTSFYLSVHYSTTALLHSTSLYTAFYHHGSTSLYLMYITLPWTLLHSACLYCFPPQLYFTVRNPSLLYHPWLYFTLLDSTLLYHASSSPLYCLLWWLRSLYLTVLPLPWLYFTWLYCNWIYITLPRLYFTLLNSTASAIAVFHFTWLSFALTWLYCTLYLTLHTLPLLYFTLLDVYYSLPENR